MIPSFAEELCKKGQGINLTADMHKWGIGVRHMGLLRDMFWRPLHGNVDLSFDSNRVRTRTDMRSQLRRGDKVSKCISTAHTPSIASGEVFPRIDNFKADVVKCHVALPWQVRIDGKVYTISVELRHQFSACTITLDRKVGSTTTNWMVTVGVDWVLTSLSVLTGC